MFSDDGLEDIARCCIDLRSLRLENDYAGQTGNGFIKRLRKFRQVFKHAKKLDHFGYRGFDEDGDYSGFEFPSNIRDLHIEDLTEVSFPFLRPYLNQLRDLHLKCVGTLKNLRDFRIYLDEEGGNIDFSLDNGVRAMLRGCKKLERLDIHLCPGVLTDVSLGFIGEYGRNIRYLSLSNTGESDVGLLELLKGCPKLRKLKL
nr:nucleosome assembly protein 1,4 [Tanacetum cinerariifolium]